MMVLVTVLEDLLTRTVKSRERVPLRSPASIADLRPLDHGVGGNVVVLRNGEHVPADAWDGTLLRENDHVTITPAPGDPSTVFLALVGIAAAAASAIMAPKFRAVDSSSESPNKRAAFSKVSSPALAGEVQPVVFGRVPRYGGKVVSVVPVNDGNGDARLKMLIDYGRGPIKAIGSVETDVDEVDLATLSGVWLNDTAASAYANCRASVRLGTAGQAIIPGFDDAEVLREVGSGGIQLRNTTGSDLPDATPGSEVVTFTTIGAVDAIIPRVALSQGLFNTTTTGQIEPRRVVYRVATKASGSGTWSAWTTVTVERAEQSRFVSAPRVAVQTPGLVHDIRCERVSKEPSALSLTERDELLWEQVVEVQDTANNYEGHALLALDLSASEQFTSEPEVACDVKGYAALRVWDGSSSPSSPTYSTGYSENPAAHVLELITNPDFGMGFAYGDGNVDLASLFDAWATADELVDRLRVGTGQRPRYRCGIALTEERQAMDWVNVLCRTMRVQHFSSGGVFHFVAEKVRDVPAEVFTDASIAREAPGDGVAGEAKFTYSRELTTGGILRPNRIVCQFANEAREGRDDTAAFPREGDLWLGGGSPEPVNEKAVRLEGITDPDQAAAEAVYLLKRERFLSRSISLTTTRAWVACRPGERFDVACTLPGWGIASGRLQAGSTTTSLRLDKGVVLDGSPAYAKVVHADGSIDLRAISSPAGTYAKGAAIALSTALSQAPAVAIPSDGAEYSIGGDGVTVKPFTCTSVRAEDSESLAWTVTGIEYDEEVFDDAAEEVEMPEYSSLGRSLIPPGPVLDLAATERMVTRGTSRALEISLSWRQTPADAAITSTFRIYRRVVGTETWVLIPSASIATRSALFDITDVDRAYQLAAVAVSLAGNSLSPDAPAVPKVTVVYGLSAPPPEAPGTCTLTQLSGNLYRLAWSEADEAVEYQYLGGGDATSLPNAGAEDCLVMGRTTALFVDLELPPGESCTFWVRSVGRSGRLSWDAASATEATPDEPAGEAIKFSSDLDIENDGTLTNLVWDTDRLDLDDPTDEGVYESIEIDGGSDTLTEITIRPHTRNSTVGVAYNAFALKAPSIEADQWGIISTGPKVVGMLMPPWPDATHGFVFEVRTKGASGSYGPWTPIAFGSSVSRVCRYVQARATISRDRAPYLPALGGLTVVGTH